MMASSVVSDRSPRVRRRRLPVHGRGAMAIASLLVLVAAFLPWVQTQLGTFWGLDGPGRWTLYAAIIGLAGTLHQRRSLLVVHALVVATVSFGLAGWQILRLLSVCPPNGCLPGIGLLLTLFGAALALRAAYVISRGHEPSEDASA